MDAPGTAGRIAGDFVRCVRNTRESVWIGFLGCAAEDLCCEARERLDRVCQLIWIHVSREFRPGIQGVWLRFRGFMDPGVSSWRLGLGGWRS